MPSAGVRAQRPFSCQFFYCEQQESPPPLEHRLVGPLFVPPGVPAIPGQCPEDLLILPFFDGAGTTPIPIKWGKLRPRRIWPAEFKGTVKDAAFLLTVGSFLLTVLLLTVDNFSFFTYNWSFFAYNFSFFACSWGFFAYSGKVRLIRTLRDCKQRSLTVRKKAPTVSKKASPYFKSVEKRKLRPWSEFPPRRNSDHGPS